jgi:hypothetical protein
MLVKVLQYIDSNRKYEGPSTSRPLEHQNEIKIIIMMLERRSLFVILIALVFVVVFFVGNDLVLFFCTSEECSSSSSSKSQQHGISISFEERETKEPKFTEELKLQTNAPKLSPTEEPTLQKVETSLPQKEGSTVHQHQQQQQNQYLYFYTHSGFSNQLFGLVHASQLAHATNRTLILPPILPHYGKDNDFPGGFKGRKAGAGCAPYQSSTQFVAVAQNDAKICAAISNYAKYSEIADISKLSQAVDVDFIELDDFIKKEPELTQKYFYEKRPSSSPSRQRIDLDGKCTVGYTRPYSEMVEYFQMIYSDDAVAILPSTFVMGNKNSESEHFQQQILAFPLSSNMLDLIKEVFARLPQISSISSNETDYSYIGTHIRYNDGYNFDCIKEDKIAFLERIHEESSCHESALVMKQNSTVSIYFASNLHVASKCYKDFFENDTSFEIFALDDLLVGQVSDEKFAAVHVQNDTILLLLDQIMVSLGRQITLKNYLSFESTFHSAILSRHEMRRQQLSLIAG